MVPHNDVQSVLQGERDAMRDFVALLEREQSALVENDTDAVMDLAEQKSEQALRLHSLVEARTALFKRRYNGLAPAAIQHELQTKDPHSWNLWLELRDFAERAQHLNQSSGELIQLKMRHNQQALAVLNNASNQANLYGANGQPSFTPGSGRPLGCA